MREKTGALIQFLAVIIMFVLVFLGIGGAYECAFDGTGLINKVAFHLIEAAVGAGIGIGGIIFGSLLKK